MIMERQELIQRLIEISLLLHLSPPTTTQLRQNTHQILKLIITIIIMIIITKIIPRKKTPVKLMKYLLLTLNCPVRLVLVKESNKKAIITLCPPLI